MGQVGAGMGGAGIGGAGMMDQDDVGGKWLGVTL